MNFSKKQISLTPSFILSVLIFIAISISTNARAQSIFVFDSETGAVDEYDATTFTSKKSVKIPQDMLSKYSQEHRARSLHISATGNIAYFTENRYSLAESPGNEEINIHEITVWGVFSGKEHRASHAYKVSKDLNHFDLEISANEDAVYLVANCSKVIPSDNKDNDRKQIVTDVIIYKLEFNKSRREKLIKKRVAGFSFDKCECATGACPETCPQGVLTKRESGINDFIVIEHLVDGQLEITKTGQSYFMKQDADWIPSSERIARETTYLETINDTGCCGWANESNDQLVLVETYNIPVLSKLTGGISNRRVVYDEIDRFNNTNYDITFFTSLPKLSPDFKWIGYTLRADGLETEDYEKPNAIRLSANGKENPQELKRIIAAIKYLPQAEFFNTLATGNNPIIVKEAEFVGWLDNDRALISKNNELSIYDLSRNKSTETHIKIKSILDVHVR